MHATATTTTATIAAIHAAFDAGDVYAAYTGLAEAGLRPLWVKSGSKIPATGPEVGLGGSGRKGWYLAARDTVEAAAQVRAVRRHESLRGTPNVALVPDGRRVAMLDFDTPAETAVAREFWERVGGDPADIDKPTVSTPGQKGEGGEWQHSDGGHLWIALPDTDDDFTSLGATIDVTGTGEDAGESVASVSLRLHSCYTLIPPSTRPEGAYVRTGAVVEAPEGMVAWLRARVADAERARREHMSERTRRAVERAAAEARGEVDDLAGADEWAESTPWSEILGDLYGWTHTRESSCGCEEWQRPGGSPRSAIAHVPGCSAGIYSMDRGHGPLHLYTTNPDTPLAEMRDFRMSQGVKGDTLTKLEVAAAIRYAEYPVEERVSKMLEAQGLAGTSYVDALPDLAGKGFSQTTAVSPVPALPAGPVSATTDGTVVNTAATVPALPAAPAPAPVATPVVDHASPVPALPAGPVADPVAAPVEGTMIEGAAPAAQASGSIDGSPDDDPLAPARMVCEAAGADERMFLGDAAAVLMIAGGNVTAACDRVRGLGGHFMRKVQRAHDDIEARKAARELSAAGAGTVDLAEVGAADSDEDAFFASLVDAAPRPHVHGLFYRTGLHLLAGRPGCGKTWASLAVLAEMASPTLYPALRINEAARRPVIYVDADGNGKHALWLRLLQLGVAVSDLQRGGDIRVVSLPEVATERRCSLEAALQATVDAAVEENAAALVLDTLTRAIVASDGDSHNMDSVTSVLNTLAPLAEKACVIVLDHTGHEHRDRPAGSTAKVGAPSTVLVMDKMHGGSGDYPDTVISASIKVSKDRHGGITRHTCDPDDDSKAGVWVLREKGTTVDRINAPGLAVEMIPARAISEKKAREEAEAEAAATPVAEIIADAMGEGGPIPLTKAVAAIWEGREGETKRGAKAALDAAVAAGTVVETHAPNRPDWKRYAPAA